MELLPEDAIERLLARHPDWQRAPAGGAIERELRFADFPTAFAFMTAVAIEAQTLDHHPDWTNAYNTVSIALTTHAAGGLTARDFELASRIDAHAERALSGH